MEAYKTFAHVYDEFMQNIPYDEWTYYIIDIIKKNNINPELVLDLGCGTGNITLNMAKMGYDMIGVDLSEDMLGIAREKTMKQGLDILYLNQDMTEFELYGTVGVVISICDSINYLLAEEDILKTFKLVNNYLDPKGIFIFDINTKYKYENIYGDHTFAETLEDSAYIWENYYNDEENINEYALTFFKKGTNDLYLRHEEFHYQKAYSIETIKRLLQKSGLKLLNIYDAFTFDDPNDKSERLYFVAQEITKV